MPQRISGLRVARSFLTPTGAANVLTAEMDFQLSARQGISISSVLGFGSYSDRSPAASDTVPAENAGCQTLHLETGSLEDVPLDDGHDEVNIDTEIFYHQQYSQLFQVWSTATGGGGGTITVQPTGLVTFDEPILSARNITHRAETVTTGTNLNAGVLIYFHYVEFSLAELGFILARRQ